MKTARVTIGGKVYEAAQLTVSEIVLVSRTLATMGKGLAADGDDAFEAIANSIETLTEVLLSSLRKINPEFIALVVQQATPNEVMAAIGVLIPASCDPATLAGQLLSTYQAHGLKEN